MDRQWAVPVQGHHSIRIEAVLQWAERAHGVHVSCRLQLSHRTFTLTDHWHVHSSVSVSSLPCRAEHVIAQDVTQRISFYITAVNPKDSSQYIPKGDLEAAIAWVNDYCHLQLWMNHCNSNTTSIMSLVPAWQTQWQALLVCVFYLQFSPSCSRRWQSRRHRHIRKSHFSPLWSFQVESRPN